MSEVGETISIGGGKSLSKSGWGQSGTLITGAKNKKVPLQCDLAGTIGAGTYTVQFNVSGINQFAAVPEALIAWRVQGQEVTRRVSIGDGVAVTGVGESVRIIMYDNTPGVFLSGNAYTVSAQVTPGSRPSTGKPPTLILPSSDGFATDVPSNGSADFIIPSGTGLISAYITAVNALVPPTALGPGALFAQFMLNLNSSLLVGETAWDTQVITGFIPAPPSAARIRLTNTTANVIQAYITLGIDG